MEPCSGAVGGESAAAASCVGQGRPMGVGFGSPFATVASEAALAAAKVTLFVVFPWCLSLAVVARHGFSNSKNTQLSKENSD